MADHTKYGGAADGMESPKPSFSIAVEFAYPDDAGNRVSEEILLPVNKVALKALNEKAGDSGILGGEARLIHNSEDTTEPGEVIVSFGLDSYYSLDELNDYTERINRLDGLSHVILLDAVAWLENDDTENMFFMVDALSSVTQRGSELSDARAQIEQLTAARKIDGYEVLQSVKIDGQEIIVGENLMAAYGKQYMLWHRSLTAHFGLESHFLPVYGADYLAIMRQFTKYVSSGLDSLDLDRVYRGDRLADPALTAEYCVPGSKDMDFKGKVVAIKPEVFSPEYRSQSHQMFLATGGFGCSQTARGRAVYVTNLYDREKLVFNRNKLLGVVDEASLPKWARDNLAAIRGEMGHENITPLYESVLAKIEEGRERQKQRKDRRRQENQEERDTPQDQTPPDKRCGKLKGETEL